MNNRIRILVGTICLFMISGIALLIQPESKTNPIVTETPVIELPEEPELTIEDYTGVQKDRVWTLEGDSGSLKIWVDFMEGNIFQLRIQTSDDTWSKVYIEEADALYEVATIENTTYKLDYTNLREYKDPVLKLPLEEDYTWEMTDGRTNTVLSTGDSLLTPIGEIETLKIKSKGSDYELIVYLGKEVGPVSIQYTSEKGSFSGKLVELQDNQRVTETIPLYLVNKQSGELEKVLQPTEIRTNEAPKHFLTDLLKKTPNEYYLEILPQGTMIQSIYLDKVADKVHVDMSKEYDFTGYTKQEEVLAIGSLVNTLCDYFNVSELVLTVEGSPYESKYNQDFYMTTR